MVLIQSYSTVIGVKIYIYKKETQFVVLVVVSVNLDFLNKSVAPCY